MYQAERWSYSERIMVKMQSTGHALNTRFIVTNLPGTAKEIYQDVYVQRGDASENRIKEVNNRCFASRMSNHDFWANSCRWILNIMTHNITIDVQAPIETIEKKEQQEAAYQDHRGSPHKEDTGSEKSEKERPWFQQLNRAKHWPIDNIRLFLLKMVAIVDIKKSRMVIRYSQSVVHQKLFHHLLFL